MVRKRIYSPIEGTEDSFDILSVTNVINRQSENYVGYMDYGKINVSLY